MSAMLQEMLRLKILEEKEQSLLNILVAFFGEHSLPSLPLPVLAIQSHPGGHMTGWCWDSTVFRAESLPSGSGWPANKCTNMGSGQMGPCLLRANNPEQKAHNRFHIIMALPEEALLLYFPD